jgi:hypothetical protein
MAWSTLPITEFIVHKPFSVLFSEGFILYIVEWVKQEGRMEKGDMEHLSHSLTHSFTKIFVIKMKNLWLKWKMNQEFNISDSAM